MFTSFGLWTIGHLVINITDAGYRQWGNQYRSTSRMFMMMWWHLAARCEGNLLRLYLREYSRWVHIAVPRECSPKMLYASGDHSALIL